MQKRVFIVHGWGGTPGEGWFPWLRYELQQRGFEVIVPQMPDTENPRIEKWIPALAKVVRKADEDTYFVGHSMGCQAIARYLETLPEETQVGGAVFVAGFFKRLTGLESEEGAQEIADSWLNTPIDLALVKSHLKKSVAIFSDNDPDVPPENKNAFRDELESTILVEHGKGHFCEDDKIKELPIVLETLLELAK